MSYKIKSRYGTTNKKDDSFFDSFLNFFQSLGFNTYWDCTEISVFYSNLLYQYRCYYFIMKQFHHYLHLKANHMKM